MDITTIAPRCGGTLDYLPFLWRGLLQTLLLGGLAATVAATAGHAALVLRTRNGPLPRAIARTYVSVMRGTPALVQLLLLFFTLPLVGLGGRPLLAATLAIGLNSGAYVCEILRAQLGIVTAGQMEAASAMGISPLQTWMRIVGPQVWRAALPALVNELTILLKTTPLASVVGVTELAYTGQMVSARTFCPDEVLALVALAYMAVILPIVLASRIGSLGPRAFGFRWSAP